MPTSLPTSLDDLLALHTTARAATGRRASKAALATLAARLDDAATTGLLAVDEAGRGFAHGWEDDALHVDLTLAPGDDDERVVLAAGLLETVTDAAWARGWRRALAHPATAQDAALWRACGFEGTGEQAEVLTAELAPPLRTLLVDDVIRLGQALKLAGLVEVGSQAKERLAAGEVRLNGEVETRRGRQLVDGDEIALGNDVVQVSLTRG